MILLWVIKWEYLTFQSTFHQTKENQHLISALFCDYNKNITNEDLKKGVKVSLCHIGLTIGLIP